MSLHTIYVAVEDIPESNTLKVIKNKCGIDVRDVVKVLRIAARDSSHR